MTSERRVVRVLCVDDHAFLAEGLRSKISREPDMEFVGWLPDPSDLLRQVREQKVDVVIMDIDMPGPDPFEVLADLQRRCPEVRAIMLSGYVRDHYIDSAVAAGAWGYLSKGDDPDQIVGAIRRVSMGYFAFGASVQDRLPRPAPETAGRPAGPASRSGLLTAREQQVLRMIGRGMSRQEIARALFRSYKTIDAHQQSIMKKLRIHDRVDLVRYAIREGLVEP